MEKNNSGSSLFLYFEVLNISFLQELNSKVLNPAKASAHV